MVIHPHVSFMINDDLTTGELRYTSWNVLLRSLNSTVVEPQIQEAFSFVEVNVDDCMVSTNPKQIPHNMHKNDTECGRD